MWNHDPSEYSESQRTQLCDLVCCVNMVCGVWVDRGIGGECHTPGKIARPCGSPGSWLKMSAEIRVVSKGPGGASSIR